MKMGLFLLLIIPVFSSFNVLLIDLFSFNQTGGNLSALINSNNLISTPCAEVFSKTATIFPFSPACNHLRSHCLRRAQF